MPVDYDFVGTGWAFPPQLTASGGIAMVRRERELEDSMRIILLTYPGERPMRPEFGSGLPVLCCRRRRPRPI